MLTILVTEPTILSNKLDCHAQIHCISFLCCCPPPQWFLYFYPEGYMLRNGGGGVRVTGNRMGSRVCACDNKNNL